MGYHVTHKENLVSKALKWLITLFSNLLRLIMGHEKHVLQGLLQFAGIYNNIFHKETSFKWIKLTRKMNRAEQKLKLTFWKRRFYKTYNNDLKLNRIIPIHILLKWKLKDVREKTLFFCLFFPQNYTYLRAKQSRWSVLSAWKKCIVCLSDVFSTCLSSILNR